MKVFISWSGEESHAVAMVLREELGCVIQSVEPFVSSEDIEKGAQWFQKIAKELEDSSFGIICLTAANCQSRWLHFEAGAIANKVSQSHVAPLLIGIEDVAVVPPLSQFQTTKLNREDFLKLLFAINRANKEKALTDDKLKRTFDLWWPDFEKKVKAAVEATPKKKALKPPRSDRELLEEVLSAVRSMSNEMQNQIPWGDNQFRGISSLADLSRLTSDGNIDYNSAPLGISGVAARLKPSLRLSDSGNEIKINTTLE